MRKIIYYVASSIDGYISEIDEDIRSFVHKSTGVDKYLSDLNEFDTVIMGRKTYEFGYKFGMKPGDAPYPHMKHYIFSESLKFDKSDKKLNICELNLEIIKKLKNRNGTPIYLCGGGELASWLLEHEMIDVLKIKLNPLILGDGVKLFGKSSKQYKLKLKKSEQFSHGLQIITYNIQY